MVKLIRGSVIDLPVSVSLNNFWCFGFVLSFLVGIQVVTGIILSFMYSPDPARAFFLVNSVMGDEVFGWFTRYMHVFGVSFIFFCMYIHIGRSLYYSSYIKLGVWNVGFCLYLVMMVEAFLGYILPWHQMSYWAATVLSSILMSVPFIGRSLYEYCVGDLSVTGGMLSRVYSVHVWLAFVILFIMVIHLFYLHKNGSNNSLSLGEGYGDVIRFHSFFTWKDAFISFSVLLLLFVFIWFNPYVFLDSESFIMANALITPVNIKPEWYFLPFYAMLRSVYSKIGGLFVVLYFLFVMWYPSVNLSCAYDVFRQVCFWVGCSSFIFLGYVGGCHLSYPFVELGKISVLGLVVLLVLFKLFWSGNSNLLFSSISGFFNRDHSIFVLYW